MISESVIESLQAIVGADNVSMRHADLEAHSIDESWFDPHLPEVIIWPSSAEQVSAIVRLAYESATPLVAWSGGSSLEGNPIPVQGGIVLAMYRMNRILEIREDDLQVVAQPGIVYDALNAQLRKRGMFFPPAPGSSDVATLGGMVANNSSGMRAVKYGVTRDYVLKLQVVLPDGRLIQIGSNAKKSTSGYDLVSLFCGSEGTLGIVTEITLRVVAFPEKVAAVLAVFDTLGDATHTVYETIRFGLNPSAIELLDAATIRVTNQHQSLSLREAPTLFIEFDGTDASIEEQIEYVRDMCEENHCTDFQSALTTDAREKLWTARKEAHDSIKFSHAGSSMISGDVCVPISKFQEMVEFVHELAPQMGVPIYAFGHAGDGNLHTETIACKDDKDEFARGLAATDRIIAKALAFGGTATGEHGVGLGKISFMRQEHGASLDIMRAIKDLVDPKGIMNPGKIFPRD